MKQALLFLAVCLSFSLSVAQVGGSQYSFAATNGTYTPISGGTTLGGAANDDNIFHGGGVYTAGYMVDPEGPTATGISIGFTFRYGTASYTHFGVNSNGGIYLGTSAARPMLIAYNGTWLTTTPGYQNNPGFNDAIFGLQGDLVARGSSSLQYLVTGTAPNRELVVQWTDYDRYSGSGGVGEFHNFQIRLQETSNRIQIIFGNVTTVRMGTSASIYQVGLRGTSEADHHLIGNIASAPQRITDPTDINESFLIGQGATPASGRTFTFTRVTTSLEDETELSVRDLRAFPTVMRNELTVQGSLERPTPLELRLDDASGRNHTVRNLNGTSTLDERMDVSGLAAGFYVLSVSDGKAVQRIKLVKQ